jgi:hypothetical protein
VTRFGLYRRQFIRRGLAGILTALAGFAAARARAQEFPKSTKEQAGYQDHAVRQPCAECVLFIPPNDCKVVQGPISPAGTCIYFSH